MKLHARMQGRWCQQCQGLPWMQCKIQINGNCQAGPPTMFAPRKKKAPQSRLQKYIRVLCSVVPQAPAQKHHRCRRWWQCRCRWWWQCQRGPGGNGGRTSVSMLMWKFLRLLSGFSVTRSAAQALVWIPHQWLFTVLLTWIVIMTLVARISGSTSANCHRRISTASTLRSKSLSC